MSKWLDDILLEDLWLDDLTKDEVMKAILSKIEEAIGEDEKRDLNAYEHFPFDLEQKVRNQLRAEIREKLL